MSEIVRRSDPCGKNHVPDVADDLLLCCPTEPSIMNKPVGHMPRPCPSIDGPRRVPMSHVAMKVLVANHFKERNLAAIRHVWVDLEPSDGRLQLLNSRRPPRVAEKVVSCGNPRRRCAAAVLR